MAIERTHLPAQPPDYLIVSPTMNRWGTVEHIGALPKMLGSVQEALVYEGLADRTWVIVGDASDEPGISQTREQVLNELLERFPQAAKIFLFTSESQKEVADKVQERTGIAEEIVDAILTSTGYASQRAKLDTVAAGLVVGNGRPLGVLSLDDDVVLPQTYHVVRPEVLPDGLQGVPNAQVLLRHEGDTAPEHLLEQHNHNQVGHFFTHLGSTVGDIRRHTPDIQATTGMTDTMHDALDHAIEGRQAHFVVTSGDDLHPNGDSARVIATVATKTGVPDYRTKKVAAASLESEFPNQEVPVNSYPTGLNQLFAFLSCRTNVDSAAFARLFDQRTAFMPWWFISNDAISRRNPLQTVTGHYRADNELLPVLFEVTHQVTGQLYMYLSGIETHVEHNRARTGYRPHVVEQAAASLVGNVAALETARKLTFDPRTGHPHMKREGLDESYSAPVDHAMQVFNDMRHLADICERKLAELQERRTRVNDEAWLSEIDGKASRYLDLHNSIRAKLGGFDFDLFHKHLSAEVRDQMLFYADVLDAMPIVIHEVARMIQNGEYPVLHVRNNEGVNTRRLNQGQEKQ